MDYSAAVIPVTRADKNLDRFDKDYKPLSELDHMNWEACESGYVLTISAYLRSGVYCAVLTRFALQYTDDADIYDGAPVGLQIVARRYEEEKVWAIAKIVSAALKAAGVD